MPQLAIPYLATALGGTALAAAGAHLIVGIGTSLLATALTKKAQGKQRQDVKLTVQMGDDLPLSFVAGEAATAGKRKYIGSWGKDRRYITEVIEYSCLPQGLDGIWVNDERGTWHSAKRWAVPPSASPGSIGDQEEVDTLPAGALDLGRPLSNLRDDGNRIYVRVVAGDQTAADPFLVWAFGADPDYPWTSAHIGRGKSYAIITTRYDSDTLTSYPTWLIEPTPLPMYDPRKDGATGGSGAHRWGNRATYEPTRNLAVIAYNVARGIYWDGEWIFGGRNLPAWRLPRAAWVAAMNACDAMITVTGGGTDPAYRGGMEISADMTAADVLEELGRGANMRFAEVGGMLKPLVDLPVVSALSITDQTVVISAGQTFAPFAPQEAVFNALSATYPSKVEKWASKDAPEYTDPDALAADGGRYLPTSVSFAAVPYHRQVRRLIRSQLRDYRRERTHQLTLPPGAMLLEPSVDMISWTSQRNGYSAKKFVVEQVAKSMSLNVLVALREVDPSDYDWTSSWQVPVEEIPPASVVPWEQAIAGFTVANATIANSAGQSRPALLASCTGGELGVSAIHIQVRRLGQTDTDQDFTAPYLSPWRWRIAELLPSTDYQVRARLLSTRTPKSAWTGWINIKTAAVKFTAADLDAALSLDLTQLHDWIEEDVVDALTTSLTKLGAVSASGVAQTIMKMQAESTPSGVLARIGLRALVGDSSDNTRVAALFLEALAGGESRVVVQADRFLVTDGTSDRAAFAIIGGAVYLSGDLIAPNSATRSIGLTREASNVVWPAPPPGYTNLDAVNWTTIYGPITWPAGTFLPVDTTPTWGEWCKGAFDLYIEGDIYNWEGPSKKLVIDFSIEKQRAGVWTSIQGHRQFLNVAAVPTWSYETFSRYIPNLSEDLTGAGALRLRARVYAPDASYAATALVDRSRCFLRQTNL